MILSWELCLRMYNLENSMENDIEVSTELEKKLKENNMFNNISISLKDPHKRYIKHQECI